MNETKEAMTMETVRKANGRGKPGPKPEVPQGISTIVNERERLLGTLERYATEINESCKGYHAAIDNSGAVPQLWIKVKWDKKGKAILSD